MDSDDLLEKEALKELYSLSDEKGLDVLYFDGTTFYESEELEITKPAYKGYYQRKFDYSGVENGISMMVEMKKMRSTGSLHAYNLFGESTLLRKNYGICQEFGTRITVLHLKQCSWRKKWHISLLYILSEGFGRIQL